MNHRHTRDGAHVPLALRRSGCDRLGILPPDAVRAIRNASCERVVWHKPDASASPETHDKDEAGNEEEGKDEYGN
ncbi:hypothetical protein PHLCEN_2v4908 [Hermanssonia centrifuga]|uniref:Uncharacterized protein n=1 Tax=Hermanssonia centrifuga TaxID=98765 RepID=A0A2R6PG10_9APHY|nr:hypothetical protein PHLCEN_2v4908 [Hermanssonia centrifuga]